LRNGSVRQTIFTALPPTKKVGLTPEFIETPGAHTFFVWRRYLADFAPQLFR